MFHVQRLSSTSQRCILKMRLIFLIELQAVRHTFISFLVVCEKLHSKWNLLYART